MSYEGATCCALFSMLCALAYMMHLPERVDQDARGVSSRRGNLIMVDNRASPLANPQAAFFGWSEANILGRVAQDGRHIVDKIRPSLSAPPIHSDSVLSCRKTAFTAFEAAG